MIHEVIARLYADAFLGYAKEGIGFDRGIKELQSVRRVFRSNPDFHDFLQRRDIALHEKYDAIDAVFADGFAAEARYFLKLLVKNKRMDRFFDIAEYARLTYGHGAKHDALLKTSGMLDLDVLERLKQKIEESLNMKLRLYVDLDPSILGGVYLRVGHTVFDGSVRRQLDDMREKLLEIKVV
ncbi:MAG: ATP synthase F1 subunit delta [Candidatus Omnitrophica bacterium]|nr:ATP synthase F1 subunit delta [Candidatus Omnitrophota bacterium]